MYKSFYWLPCQWIRALFYQKNNNVSTSFAAILGFCGAEVRCKFWLNWTLMEAVCKWPVRRRETIQVVGLCLLQSPSIIAIIVWKQTNKTSHWLAVMCFERLFTVYHQQIKNQFKSVETVKVTCSSLLVKFFFQRFYINTCCSALLKIMNHI